MKWLQSLRRGKQSTSQNLREDATRIATRTALIGGTFLVAKIGLDAYLKSQPKKTQSQIDINYRGRS